MSVTTNVVGGLGNQLFLVANLISVAKRHPNLKAWIPRDSWSSSCDAPRPTYWNSLLKTLPFDSTAPAGWDPATCIQVPETRPVGLIQVPSSSSSSGNHHQLVGFFQSEEFFSDCKNEVKGVFLGDTMTVNVANEMHKAMFAQRDMAAGANAMTSSSSSPPSPSQQMHTVAIHVRRGDYLKHADTFAQLDSGRYYGKALEILYGKMLWTRNFSMTAASPSSSPSSSGGSSAFHYGSTTGHVPLVRALLFGEDLPWMKTFKGALEVKYPSLSCVVVTEELEKQKALLDQAQIPQEVLELLLMAQCNDCVIANSSFSWWGAYLGSEVPFQRVVAPSEWFVKEPYPKASHLYCKDWVVL